MKHLKRKILQITLPSYWSGEQALAVLECLQLLREAILKGYGSEIQRAWREQLEPMQEVVEVDPNEPF
jgi:hypothetical protein